MRMVDLQPSEERYDETAPAGDRAKAAQKSAQDLITWERLPDLLSSSNNATVLHPEFVDGRRALHPSQDGFIDAGNGQGIGWALIDDMALPW